MTKRAEELAREYLSNAWDKPTGKVPVFIAGYEAAEKDALNSEVIMSEELPNVFLRKGEIEAMKIVLLKDAKCPKCGGTEFNEKPSGYVCSKCLHFIVRNDERLQKGR